MIMGKDRKGRLIYKDDQVLMPDPIKGDGWVEGNFVCSVEYTKEGRDENGRRINLIIVEDALGDCWDIEPERVLVDDERYPIYCPEDKKELPEGLYLALFHGFKNEKERTDYGDWGSNGAIIGPVDYVHTTYGQHIKLKFSNPDDHVKYNLPIEVVDELSINSEGCLEYDDMQYGDWTVFYNKKG